MNIIEGKFISNAVNNHIDMIRALEAVREALKKNVYETGQPGTWATHLDDMLALTLYNAKTLDDKERMGA